MQVVQNNKTMNFNSVDSILRGLRGKTERQKAAIEAASRYSWPEDCPEERAEVVELIEAIGRETADVETRKLCVSALWELDTHACVRLGLHLSAAKA